MVLRLIEQTVPVERIWLEVSESGGAAQPITSEDMEQQVTQLSDALLAVRPMLANQEHAERLLDQLHVTEPAVRARVLVNIGEFS
ncbi:hypothetical protein GCM10027188_08210 [Lysobacter humi (ex Lee et al. 2017)]